MKFCLVISLLAAATSASASEMVVAQRMPQTLDTRGAFVGGWPIAATTCPSTTNDCGDGSCCPSSTQCYTAGLAGVAVCCPNASDCSTTANTLPVCADSSATLYIGNYYYFCCTTGQVGILPNPADSVVAGLCVDSSASPPASVLASPYRKQAATSTTPTASSTSSPAPTVSSASSASTSTKTGDSTSTPTPTPLTTTSNSASASGSGSLLTTVTSSTTSPSPISTSSSSSASQSPTSHHKSSTKIDPIVGGAVGGVLLLTIAVGIWCCISRRRKNKDVAQAQPYEYNPMGPVEKYGESHITQWNEAPGQMAGNYGLNEVQATEAHSKPAAQPYGRPPAELP